MSVLHNLKPITRNSPHDKWRATPFVQHKFFTVPLLLQVNGLGLPVTAAEARLLIVEYGGTARGGTPGEGKGEGGAQLSLDDFDGMIRRKSRVSITGTTGP